MTAAVAFDDIRRDVLTVYPFFGSVAAGLEYDETDEIRTMGNDGKTIYWNPAYLAGLSESARVFVLAHELCHIAFGHIPRSRGKNMEVWKAATDAVINQMLLRDGLEPAPGAIDYPEAADCDAERFYEILLKQKLEIELIGGNIAGGGGAGSEGAGDSSDPCSARDSGEPSGADDSDDPLGADGLDESSDADDTHRLWEDALQQEDDAEREKEEELFRRLARLQELAEALKELGGDDPGSMDDMDGMDGTAQEGGAAEPDDEELSPEDFALLGRTVSRAGNSVTPDTRPMGEVGTAPPLIDWRLLLRDTINYGVDWSFTNAVLEDGIVRPALEEHPMPETEIVLDTSWSVDEELLRNFLRECRNILQLSKLKAGCFDTVFYGFQEIRTAKDIEDMRFEGGGGTDFQAAADAFTMRVDNRIIFTDGEADMPDRPLDAIWVVYGDKTIQPPGGTVIHITPEQMERLRG